MNRLTEILQQIQEPGTTPGTLSASLMYLSADYSKKTDELQQLLVLKATSWPRYRKDAGSDKQADKAWDSTPDGIMEMGLRLQLKSLEKLMSAIKAHLRVKETEARNQF